MAHVTERPCNVLFLVDSADAKHIDSEPSTPNWTIVSRVLDFRDLHASVEEIRRLATRHEIDFLIYSQNDQVGKRVNIGPIHKHLRLGYSSISGIDRGDERVRVDQMRNCLQDFLTCLGPLPKSMPRTATEGTATPASAGSFSLAFDTEQLGGVRYGLPRLLRLLAKHQVRSTFFATNLVDRVYRGLFAKLVSLGHEVAPHGLWHEDLSLLSIGEQTEHLKSMVGRLSVSPVGANFIGRMNEDTINALIQIGIKYFVYFDTNFFRLTSYPKPPTGPTGILTPVGEIWAIPVLVETYGAPWFSIRNMLDTAVYQTQRCGFPHVTVLCHPFRDGSINNIETTERLLTHLLRAGLRPITLGELATRIEDLGGSFPRETNVERFLKPKRPTPSLPSTRWDFMGLVPQTTVSIMKRLSRRSLF